MATVWHWMEAARPKTLPASLAPVLLGMGAAQALGYFSLGKSLLALLVALSLQVGVNYANDYSDGIRGTDKNRRGPLRLTGAGLAQPKQVLMAALGSFGIAAFAGLGLVLWSRSWWLLLAGIAAVTAAWFYTGGKRPYGYMSGISEIMVFVFFGLLATLGTLWVQVAQIPVVVWVAACGIGLLSCALLMVNNLRDIPGDTDSGKITLAVRLGDRISRLVFAQYICLAAIGGVIALSGWKAKVIFLLGYIIFAVKPTWRVSVGAKGSALIICLKELGILTLVYALLVGGGWVYLGI